MEETHNSTCQQMDTNTNKNTSSGRITYLVPFIAFFATMALCYFVFPESNILTADPKKLIWMSGIRSSLTLPAFALFIILALYAVHLLAMFVSNNIGEIDQKNSFVTVLLMTIIGVFSGVTFFIYVFFPSIETVKMML